MRQKQSKENSRKYHQKSDPAVKREAERLSTPTNTMEKNEKASLESRIASGIIRYFITNFFLTFPSK